ncbi:MAG: DNA polymerase III subunit beta [Tannerellaceae bacterium]|jgi:DNA polymerase-3 subunit beta|nr:DNA polymerase III subunit beta [Tannerellaceae bacterium]
MKFEVSSAALQSRLQSISKVIASKNPLPILDSFLFELSSDKLTITASDVETRMVTSVGVTGVEGEGMFAIPAKMLLEPLKELPEQPLRFEINDENMEILFHFENGKYNLIGSRGDTYPQQKALSSTFTAVSVDAQTLLNGITRSLFATADDELRPVMNGIYFDIHQEDLTFVASDGHKLVRLTNKSIQSAEAAAFILPKKPANLLRNILAKETESVEIKFDENNAYITCHGFEMVCRLIEGRYPNYNSVIPQDNPHKVTIDRIAMLNALKRVSIFANASSSLIKLQIRSNRMIVSAQDLDFSTSAEEQVACFYDGEELNIGFKATFLIEILSNIASESVNLELADPSRAGIVVPTEDAEQENLLMLLMPMMLND